MISHSSLASQFLRLSTHTDLEFWRSSSQRWCSLSVIWSVSSAFSSSRWWPVLVCVVTLKTADFFVCLQFFFTFLRTFRIEDGRTNLLSFLVTTRVRFNLSCSYKASPTYGSDFPEPVVDCRTSIEITKKFQLYFLNSVLCLQTTETGTWCDVICKYTEHTRVRFFVSKYGDWPELHIEGGVSHAFYTTRNLDTSKSSKYRFQVVCCVYSEVLFNIRLTKCHSTFYSWCSMSCQKFNMRGFTLVPVVL